MNEICAMRNRFADFVAKFELYETLTRREAEFMNEISVAVQKFNDSKPLTNFEKEELH
jgi:hypothetical protein